MINEEDPQDNLNLSNILEFFPVDSRYPNFYIKSNNVDYLFFLYKFKN